MNDRGWMRAGGGFSIAFDDCDLCHRRRRHPPTVVHLVVADCYAHVTDDLLICCFAPARSTVRKLISARGERGGSGYTPTIDLSRHDA